MCGPVVLIWELVNLSVTHEELKDSGFAFHILVIKLSCVCVFRQRVNKLKNVCVCI